MNAWPPRCFASPSDLTTPGRAVWRCIPIRRSLGIAISEAVEDAATHSDTNYSLGSVVLNHVCFTRRSWDRKPSCRWRWPAEPDVGHPAVLGGSSFGGITLPNFLDS